MSTWKHVTRELLDVLREQYRLARHAVHGIGHWNRVRENGLRLAKSTGADVMAARDPRMMRGAIGRSTGL